MLGSEPQANCDTAWQAGHEAKRRAAIANPSSLALSPRGLVEITRLGVAMGANRETFAGLSGMGYLVTTCISPHGRNRSFGQAIAKSQNVKQVLDSIPGQVEGVNTARSMMGLSRQYDIEMPITKAVYEIIFTNKPVNQAIAELMTRQLKPENILQS
jgi:glycerol-3-phosphate dehydrogenase (NAD(P)+)